MIKIGMTVRNRLAMTKKTIQCLYKHTTSKFHLYIFNNSTNYKVKEHYEYFAKLYEEGLVAQVTFNTNVSNNNAFGKASSLNCFGFNHQQDPNKDKYDWLLILDNDILVVPEWDKLIRKAWEDVERLKLKKVKVISQHPSGIKHGSRLEQKIAGHHSYFGQLGGSCFWNVKPNFYKEIGYLNLKQLQGVQKKHDQIYWQKLRKVTGGSYILGLKTKLFHDCGGYAGSICNVVGYGTNKQKLERIKYKERDKEIEEMKFSEFYEKMRKR